MALPQVNGLCATRPAAVLVDVAGRLQACSAETVLEAGEPGDKGPPALAKELRLGGIGCTSFSHEDRRPGLGGSGFEDGACSCGPCRSGSSSLEAITSESGVERLATNRLLSSRIELLDEGMVGKEARDEFKGGALFVLEAMCATDVVWVRMTADVYAEPRK